MIYTLGWREYKTLRDVTEKLIHKFLTKRYRGFEIKKEEQQTTLVLEEKGTRD
jgi:hypothetical protein